MVREDMYKMKDEWDEFDPTIRLPNQFAPGGPCIPGKMRLFVDTGGNFYPCERVSGNSEVMRIGNSKDGMFFDKIETLLNIGSLTPETCRNCWAFSRCTLCAKHADCGDSLSGKMKLKYCDGVRGNFESTLYSIVLFQEFKTYYL